jgi:hypothetical protein
MSRIRVGKPDVAPDGPSHVPGTAQGNVGPNHEQPGHHPDGTMDSRRSTGINPRTHDPLNEEMPNLPPG